MRLVDLEPNFVDAGGEGIRRADGSPAPHRRGVGLTLRCPCGCGEWRYVAFTNPLDGGPTLQPERAHWQREGDTFDALTLRPSILSGRAEGGCGWHGFVTNGEAEGRVE